MSVAQRPPGPAGGRTRESGRELAALTAVCLKMLFRPSTRGRFIALLAIFVALMGFNTAAYTGRLMRSESAKRALLDQPAFDLFFLRARTPGDLRRLTERHGPRLSELGGRFHPGAFVYQNVLFLDGGAPGGADDLFRLFDPGPDRSLFHPAAGGRVRAANASLRYGTAEASPRAARENDRRFGRDLADIAALVRGELRGRRLAIYNGLVDGLVASHRSTDYRGPGGANPWMSRVERLAPLHLVHLWAHLAQDTTTDIFDWGEMAFFAPDGTLTAPGDFLRAPAGRGPAAPAYRDTDIYPRYIPLQTPALIAPAAGGPLGRPLRLDRELAREMENLHSGDHPLFAREKLHYIRQRVAQVNAEIRANHRWFYLTDLAAGLGFPFMMSLFAFVHLKAELAFLLMLKNRIRQVRFIFWLLPVTLMAAAKGAAVAGMLAAPDGPPLAGRLAGPLALSLAAAALGFVPLNRWCFAPFGGRRIDLYALHRGK